MAFVKKTWKDRIAEFPTRRRLTKSNGDSELVTVAREEGTLSQEGDAFSAENMNDLENRIDAEFTAVNSNLNQKISNIINIANNGSVDVSGCKLIFFQIVTNNIIRASGFMSALTDNTIKSIYKGSSADWTQTFELINNQLNFTSTNTSDSANIICIM